MNSTPALTFVFHVHGERLAIARLPADAAVPAWADGGWCTTSRTATELSIVCAQSRVPASTLQERDKIALGIDGVIPMTSIGILAALSVVLANASVPIFVISTFDTDWLLVSVDRFEAARAALSAAGHTVRSPPPAH
jgi:hypothetical protein